jgi:Zn finger protein HypA/HybF involved in hydrogenase expression
MKKKITDMKKYQKEYYAENKERILEKMKRKIYCECCDKYVPKYKFPQHCRTKKHIRNMENNLKKGV